MTHRLLVALLLTVLQWQHTTCQTVKVDDSTHQIPTTQDTSNISHETSLLKTGQEIITNNDFMAVDQNRPTTSAITANDLGLNSGIKSVEVIEDAKNGKVEILPDFSARYTPNRNYIGLDNFRYRVCNNNRECGHANVKIGVRDVDFKPLGIADSAAVKYFSYSVFNVLANDIDIFDDPITVTIIKSSENSDSEILFDNTLNYHPHRNFWGLDALTYQVCDNDGDCSTATIYIDVAEWTMEDIVIPNGMSPNGDGMNDYFEIQEFNHFDNKVNMNIFNAWGDLVYKNETYLNNWDGIANTGTSKGKKVAIGTYYYMIMVEGTSNPLTGYIYITY